MCVCEKEGNSHHSRVQDLSHSSGDHNLCGLRACRDEMRWDGMGWDAAKKNYIIISLLLCAPKGTSKVALCWVLPDVGQMTLTLTRL